MWSVQLPESGPLMGKLHHWCQPVAGKTENAWAASSRNIKIWYPPYLFGPVFFLSWMFLCEFNLLMILSFTPNHCHWWHIPFSQESKAPSMHIPTPELEMVTFHSLEWYLLLLRGPKYHYFLENAIVPATCTVDKISLPPFITLRIRHLITWS